MLAVCICRKGTHDEKLAWTFRLYDTDGSGSIDFEEVKMNLPFWLCKFKAVNWIKLKEYSFFFGSNIMGRLPTR